MCVIYKKVVLCFMNYEEEDENTAVGIKTLNADKTRFKKIAILMQRSVQRKKDSLTINSYYKQSQHRSKLHTFSLFFSFLSLFSTTYIVGGDKNMQRFRVFAVSHPKRARCKLAFTSTFQLK